MAGTTTAIIFNEASFYNRFISYNENKIKPPTVAKPARQFGHAIQI